MAKSTTTRFGLQRWTADGDTQHRSEFDASFANLASNAAGWLPPSTLADRPAAAAANERFFHRSTDTGQLAYSTGSGTWINIPDPLSELPPPNPVFGVGAASGSSSAGARSDHVHALGVPRTPAQTGSSSGTAGVDGVPARSDHRHGYLTAVGSTQAFGDAAAQGVASSISRSDHKHAMPANPVPAHEAAADPHAVYLLEADHTKALHDALGIDADTVDGSHAADLLARANHTGTQTASTISNFNESVASKVGSMVSGNTEAGINVSYQSADETLDFTLDFSGIAPEALTPDNGGYAGSSVSPSRHNHRHNVPTASAIGLSHLTANAEGTSATFARSDHSHSVVFDHGSLVGNGDDDHTLYARVDGARAFTGEVAGVTPTADASLATKGYVDASTPDTMADVLLLMGA